MIANRADVSIKMQGYTAANRDATITLTSQATGKPVSTKPFLDGSAVVRDLDPGLYQVVVTHPNLINPIYTNTIRVFPQVQPTQINIQVPDVLFKDTPIADIPDADLGPVQTMATDVKTRATSVGSKMPGEAILAEDWNKMASAVGDLAAAVAQLTLLVSPRGHDHPEIAAKIDEVQGNVIAFSEAFGRTVLEIRRQFEIDGLRSNTDEVLTLAAVDNATRKDITDRIDALQAAVQKDTVTYTQLLTNLGTLLLTRINALGVTKGQSFLQDIRVLKLMARARAYANSGVQTQPQRELNVYTMSSGSVLAANNSANASA